MSPEKPKFGPEPDEFEPTLAGLHDYAAYLDVQLNQRQLDIEVLEGTAVSLATYLSSLATESGVKGKQVNVSGNIVCPQFNASGSIIGYVQTQSILSGYHDGFTAYPVQDSDHPSASTKYHFGHEIFLGETNNNVWLHKDHKEFSICAPVLESHVSLYEDEKREELIEVAARLKNDYLLEELDMALFNNEEQIDMPGLSSVFDRARNRPHKMRNIDDLLLYLNLVSSVAGRAIEVVAPFVLQNLGTLFGDTVGFRPIRPKSHIAGRCRGFDIIQGFKIYPGSTEVTRRPNKELAMTISSDNGGDIFHVPVKDIELYLFIE